MEGLEAQMYETSLNNAAALGEYIEYRYIYYLTCLSPHLYSH